MDALLKLAEFAVLQRVIGPYAPFNTLGKVKLFLALFIIIFTLTGLTFSLVGYYFWLNAILAQPQALMIFGASLMVLSVLMICGYMYAQIIKERKKAQMRNKVKDEITEALLLIDQKFQEHNPVQSHPAASIITSALCGYALGEKAVRR
tara:strand:+ start:2241 stop:2687 length:447 start_codon:yes stop_codon:yes gene_type:complete